jgi:hypothetical protein
MEVSTRILATYNKGRIAILKRPNTEVKKFSKEVP